MYSILITFSVDLQATKTLFGVRLWLDWLLICNTFLFYASFINTCMSRALETSNFTNVEYIGTGFERFSPFTQLDFAKLKTRLIDPVGCAIRPVKK